MPLFGIGLHVLAALFFAVHAVRTGREMYWLLILFLFPLLGSLVYFVAIYLPESRIPRAMRSGAASAAQALDPGRGLREARQAFERTPSAENRLHLALALLESGDAAQAIGHYEACLNGPFGQDPDIRLGAARARLDHGEADAAIGFALSIRTERPYFRPEQVALLLGQALALAGRVPEARAELESALARFGSLEARVELAIFALGQGDRATADAQWREIQDEMGHWSPHTRSLNRPVVRRLEEALAAHRHD
jgi:hypothetical protein